MQALRSLGSFSFNVALLSHVQVIDAEVTALSYLYSLFFTEVIDWLLIKCFEATYIVNAIMKQLVKRLKNA